MVLVAAPEVGATALAGAGVCCTCDLIICCCCGGWGCCWTGGGDLIIDQHSRFFVGVGYESNLRFIKIRTTHNLSLWLFFWMILLLYWHLVYFILKVLAWEFCNVKWGFAKKVIIKSQRQLMYGSNFYYQTLRSFLIDSILIGFNLMPFTAWKHTERKEDRKNDYCDFMRFGDSSTVPNLLKQ